MINFIESDELIDKVGEYDVTLVASNIYATMCNGFAEDVKQRFPYVYNINTSTKYGDSELLGKVIECQSTNEPTFALCYIYKIKKKNVDMVNYDALSKVLRYVNTKYKGKKIATTLLGWDQYEGNGDKDRIVQMFNDHIKQVDVDVYVFQQDSHIKKWAKALKQSKALKNDKEKWETFIKESKRKITRIKNENSSKSHKRPFKTYSVRLNQQ